MTTRTDQLSGDDCLRERMARYMVDAVREAGRVTRGELLAALTDRFEPVDHLDGRLLKEFRRLHAGTVRYEAAGQYWVSLRARETPPAAAGSRPPVGSSGRSSA